MKRPRSCLAVLATVPAALGWALGATLAAGCGDNARECGVGTEDVDGICAPINNTVCGDGTKLDEGRCVIDPTACQSGTVLVAGRCTDPTAALLIDLEESFEPNGLAIATGVEPSPAPAGTIALKPIDQSFVVHGHITPFRDADADGQLDPDVDSYLLTAAAPTLLEITVDGVGGAQGAFYLAGDPAGPVASYERYGLNLTGDTTRRQVFLPSPGVYTLAFSDTRALAIGRNPPPPAGAGAAAGGADAEYYATITARAIPTPAALTAGAAVSQPGALATDQVALFNGGFAVGSNRVQLAMPGAAAASLAVLAGDALVGYADEQRQPPKVAEVIAAVAVDAAPVIVVDAVYNYGPAPAPFTVSITAP